METINFLLDGFDVAFTVQNITLALIGCFLGTIFGALPGLGPANGVAILIPISFSLGLDAASSMILLASVYYGAMYGGRISSILINIPGDEPALMTTLDGYPMTLKGRAGEALTLTGISSFFWSNCSNYRSNVFSTATCKNCSSIWSSRIFCFVCNGFCNIRRGEFQQ